MYGPTTTIRPRTSRTSIEHQANTLEGSSGLAPRSLRHGLACKNDEMSSTQNTMSTTYDCATVIVAHSSALTRTLLLTSRLQSSTGADIGCGGVVARKSASRCQTD